MIVGINVFNSFPDLFIQINVASLAEDGSHIFVQVGVKQAGHIITGVLCILVYLVWLHLLKGQQPSMNKSIIPRGLNGVGFIGEQVNSGTGVPPSVSP